MRSVSERTVHRHRQRNQQLCDAPARRINGQQLNHKKAKAPNRHSPPKPIKFFLLHQPKGLWSPLHSPATEQPVARLRYALSTHPFIRRSGTAPCPDFLIRIKLPPSRITVQGRTAKTEIGTRVAQVEGNKCAGPNEKGSGAPAHVDRGLWWWGENCEFREANDSWAEETVTGGPRDEQDWETALGERNLAGVPDIPGQVRRTERTQFNPVVRANRPT